MTELPLVAQMTVLLPIGLHYLDRFPIPEFGVDGRYDIAVRAGRDNVQAQA